MIIINITINRIVITHMAHDIRSNLHVSKPWIKNKMNLEGVFKTTLYKPPPVMQYLKERQQ